nr:unnamed protein product [Digitaria exilis]
MHRLGLMYPPPFRRPPQLLSTPQAHNAPPFVDKFACNNDLPLDLDPEPAGLSPPADLPESRAAVPTSRSSIEPARSASFSTSQSSRGIDVQLQC